MLLCHLDERLDRHLVLQFRLKRRDVRAQRQTGGKGLQQAGIFEWPRAYFELLKELFEHRHADTQLVEHLFAAHLRLPVERKQVPEDGQQGLPGACDIAKTSRLFSR